ncbi:hypothetical protein [Agromyces mariniharenae]|uniref:Uncharacterized protein n=1 Tax=Agromyces mariniharenae TaxID=2604423 RepID=A0A5S4V169_9MICO|nr:hypothetical protein [Agromyces mariniharenae]TYL51041.1 hypothetical protein FYC51_18085 [Agromyces mariniharenae]
MPPITIACPVCGARVRVLAEGYVDEHTGRGGLRCSFTKTASSPGGSKAPTPPREKKAAETPKETSAVPPPTKKDRPKKPAEHQACPACGLVVGVSGDGELYAHQRADGRWCKEGQKAKGKRKPRRSIRALRGGLPGLGRK